MAEFRNTSSADSIDQSTFQDWIGGRTLPSLGTNAGAESLPFQKWRHFKEAFAPELVQQAILASEIPVRRCVDPFGGSGTTALACQFLGVHPVTVEVNPYLADLAEAKLTTYDVDALARDFGRLVKFANRKRLSAHRYFQEAPPTFVEPGLDERWIFDAPVGKRLAAYASALPEIRDVANRRLLRVLLGGVLIGLSNVVISGKGRRYRRNWQELDKEAADLDEAFCEAVEDAVDDILRYAARKEVNYTIIRGDARKELSKIDLVDIAVLSPPYPNSFDYTDVYNVELWGLGYLRKRNHNRQLRLSTLSSHVQIKRKFAEAPKESKLLNKALRRLEAQRAELWNGNIPDMVAGYFADMSDVIRSLANRMRPRGQIWMVVGDSKYANVKIPVADILAELAPQTGCRLIKMEPFRSMRTSAQQGNSATLQETLVVLGRF